MAQTKKTAKKLALTCTVAVLTIAMMVVLFACGSAGTTTGNTQAANTTASGVVLAQGENLVIPTNEISATARFYPVVVDGVNLEVLAVKAPDGSIRTAFNTCQICYDSGRGYYKQEGNVLVCQNCGNRFGMSQVEIESGGCNPWPIFDENKTVTGDAITISRDFLEQSIGIFAKWKGNY